MMKLAVRQQRYRLKKTFFDPFPLHLVMKTSPINSMSDKQWIDLVESWKTPEKMVCFSSQKLNFCMYILLCDTPYITFANDVGHMSNEQRQPRQCYVTSNYRVTELHGLC